MCPLHWVDGEGAGQANGRGAGQEQAESGNGGLNPTPAATAAALRAMRRKTRCRPPPQGKLYHGQGRTGHLGLRERGTTAATAEAAEVVWGGGRHEAGAWRGHDRLTSSPTPTACARRRIGRALNFYITSPKYNEDIMNFIE